MLQAGRSESGRGPSGVSYRDRIRGLVVRKGRIRRRGRRIASDCSIGD